MRLNDEHVSNNRRTLMDWRDTFDASLLDPEAVEFLCLHELDEKAGGITKLVMTKGIGSLSAKQLYVFKTEVVDKWLSVKCKMGHDVEGHELVSVWWGNDGYCGRCAHQMSKDD